MAQYLEYGLEGRVAIITGAGSGIGDAEAIELAKGGAKTVLFGRHLDKLEQVADECRKYTNDVLPLAVDVSSRESVQEGVGKVLQTYGRVEILMNNAGIESRLQPGESFFNDLFEELIRLV